MPHPEVTRIVWTHDLATPRNTEVRFRAYLGESVFIAAWVFTQPEAIRCAAQAAYAGCSLTARR